MTEKNTFDSLDIWASIGVRACVRACSTWLNGCLVCVLILHKGIFRVKLQRDLIIYS